MSNETTPVEAGTTDPVSAETTTETAVEPQEMPEGDAGEATAVAPATDGVDTESTDTESTDTESTDTEDTDTEDTDVERANVEPAADETEGEEAAADEVEVDEVEVDEATPATDDEPGEAPARSGRRAQLEREGEVAADFLETLLDICDLDGDLDVDIDGDRAAVAIVDSDEGRVPRRLVGADAQVLEALQELTRLAVQSETGERSRLMLDVAGHRAERRAELVSLAKEAIAEVQSSGERKSLTPMTAFERKVVHDEVLAAGLVSESEGSEPRRFVVISPA